jgi:hypothetical protein
MMRNTKIAEYLGHKNGEKAHEIGAYLGFFVEHLDELERVLTENESLWRGDSMRKYCKLSDHIDHKHNIKWKNGTKIPPAMTRNLYKLACKERQASLQRRGSPKKRDTVFKVYCPDDDFE